MGRSEPPPSGENLTGPPPPARSPKTPAADRLAAMLADLEGFIERRAAELARPAIEAAERSREACDARVPDLQREFGRQIGVLEGRLERYRAELAAVREDRDHLYGLLAERRADD